MHSDDPIPELHDPIPELKEALAQAITDRLTGWTQEMAAALIGIDQPRMSNLRNGRLERFSLAHLIRLLTRLGAAITLDLAWPKGWWNRPRPPRRGSPPGALLRPARGSVRARVKPKTSKPGAHSDWRRTTCLLTPLERDRHAPPGRRAMGARLACDNQELE